MAHRNAKNTTEKPSLDATPSTSPQKASVTALKRKFIEDLEANGGIASHAFKTSGLPRRTAYRYYAEDPEFAEAWNEAISEAYNTLYAEARRRALEGTETVLIDKSGNQQRMIKKSDKLLIHLLNLMERRAVWHRRMTEIGTASLQVLSQAGREAGITQEQISEIHNAMIKKYKDIKMD